MMLKILSVLVILLLAVLGFAAAKPKTIHLHRSITIDAPPEKIFALLDDFHNRRVAHPSYHPSERLNLFRVPHSSLFEGCGF
jgi:hypothetical protein